MSFFALGFLLGAIGLNILNIYTSDTYLNLLRSKFRAEQQSIAIDAANNHNNISMLVSQYNVVNTFSDKNSTVFNRVSSGYDFWLPFHLIVLKQIVAPIGSSKGEKTAEGIERGKLAYTLELAGMPQSAEQEWKKAIELIGYNNGLDKFKIFISTIILAFAASRHKNALFRYSVKNIIRENNIVRDMSVRMRLKYVGTHISNYSL